MPITWLYTEPMFFVAWVMAIVIALTLHEFSHAAAALYFGDDTAKSMGRLTLNPLAHLDWLGFAMLLFVGFGWAKPVPVNPYNLRNPRISSALVSLAGPFANLISLIVFGLLLKFLGPTLGPQNLLVNFLFMLVLINVVLMAFNLIPIPPLDGHQVLFAILPDRYNDFKYKLALNGPWILIILVMVDNFLNIGIFAALFNWIFQLVGRFL
ncbi:site-2 protease family protein [Candidatus Falkowbacteria bacterium]|nr:site-2 protease family protein [Candidatus Falkowbacteria bacterium]